MSLTHGSDHYPDFLRNTGFPYKKADDTSGARRSHFTGFIFTVVQKFHSDALGEGQSFPMPPYGSANVCHLCPKVFMQQAEKEKNTEGEPANPG